MVRLGTDGLASLVVTPNVDQFLSSQLVVDGKVESKDDRGQEYMAKTYLKVAIREMPE